MNREQIFGEQMRLIRKARGLSQGDLCKALAGTGIPQHQSTISKIEEAQRPLRLNEAVAIAAALGTDLNSMVGDVAADPDAAVLAYVARVGELERAIGVARRALAKVEGRP